MASGRRLAGFRVSRWLRRRHLFVVALGGFLCISVPAPFAPLGSTVYAQEDGNGEGQPEERKTKQTGSMGQKVYKLLSEAQALSDEENFAAAIAKLDEIKAMPKLTPYETAQLYNFYGFVYYSQERYADSVRAYRKVLEQPELPEGLRTQTIYTLAQLSFTTEDYKGAIELIKQYIAEAENPGPEPFVLIGTAYYQLEQYDKIIEPLEQAMAIARDRDSPIKENWWLLLRVAYWEQENFKKVREILETLVVGWPKKEYWTQLSAIYFELEQEQRQLAAYESAYDQGLLQKDSEIVQLAQLFLQAQVPYKAARTLEKEMEAEVVERNAKNMRLLSQAWSLAQEDLKAVPALKEAARLSDDGELDVRLAQSYLNLSRYKECIEAARQGIKKGDLKRTDTANMILGMCLFETDSMDSAKNAFRQAARDDRSSKNANSWLQYIESEEQRQRELERSLQMVRRTTG